MITEDKIRDGLLRMGGRLTDSKMCTVLSLIIAELYLSVTLPGA